jgi:hypothetical protein
LGGQGDRPLAADLHTAFPDMKGFSTRNLEYMRSLAEAYPDEAFVQEALAQITRVLVITSSWDAPVTSPSSPRSRTRRPGE